MASRWLQQQRPCPVYRPAFPVAFPAPAKTCRRAVAGTGTRAFGGGRVCGTAVATVLQGGQPMLLGLYDTKDALRQSLGQPLHYMETQLLVCEYRPSGVVAVRGAFAGGDGRSWIAEVTLRDGQIVHVD